MARSRNSQKSKQNTDGTRPETREEKRQRIARNKAKMAEHKKLAPVILAGVAGVVIILPIIIVFIASLASSE